MVAKGQVGGGAVFPLENRFSNRGQPSSIDRIYEVDTGPNLALQSYLKVLYGYSIGRDSVNRFPQKVLQTCFCWTRDLQSIRCVN